MINELNLSTIENEIIKRKYYDNNIYNDLEKEWFFHVNKFNKKISTKLISTFNFAKKIKYKHTKSKINSYAYFTHPLRVSLYCVKLRIGNQLDIGILSLLHNVLEVSNMHKKILKKKFGNELVNYLDCLNIDRSKRWNENYLKKYYKKIYSTNKIAQIVKCMDKFDNLFLLHENKDKLIKKKYIQEINKFVIPMVKKYLPDLLSYYRLLIKYNLKVLK